MRFTINVKTRSIELTEAVEVQEFINFVNEHGLGDFKIVPMGIHTDAFDPNTVTTVTSPSWGSDPRPGHISSPTVHST